MDIEKQVEKLTKAVERLADQWEEIGNRTTANAVQIGFVRDDLNFVNQLMKPKNYYS